MNMNPDSEGWYHDVPAKTLDEWKEGQKIWGCKYDQTFCRPGVTKMKKKRKPKYNVHVFRLTGLMDGDRETSKDNKCVKQKTCRRAVKSKLTKEKHEYDRDIQVFVKTSISVTQCLKLKQTTSIQDVKTLVQDRLGVSSKEMQLYSRNLKLCDLLSLEDHGVTDQSNIEMHLSPGLLGGADRPDNSPENNSSAADKSQRQTSSASQTQQLQADAERISTSKQNTTSTPKAADLEPSVKDAQLSLDVANNVETGCDDGGAQDHEQTRDVESTFDGESKPDLPKEQQQLQEDNLDDEDEDEDYDSDEEDIFPVCEELAFVEEGLRFGGPPELPQSLDSNCKNHHEDYLSLDDTFEVCRSNKDHIHSSIIRGIGEQSWKELADSIVLLSIYKNVTLYKPTNKKEKEDKRLFYGTGFVVRSSPGNAIPAGQCAIMTACHNVLHHRYSYKKGQLVDCKDITVAFFHDGLNHVKDDQENEVVVYCKVTGIASEMQSLPQREYGASTDKKHMDYVVLYADIGEKIEELESDIDKKDINPQLKKIKCGHIKSLRNLLEFDCDKSALIQLMEASCSDETSGNKFVLICIGHPHAAPKQVSFGHSKSDTSTLFHTLKPKRTHVCIKHSCASCPGSSGSPISALMSYGIGGFHPESIQRVLRQVNFLHIQSVKTDDGIAIAIQSIVRYDDTDHIDATDVVVASIENVIAIGMFLEEHNYCATKKTSNKIKKCVQYLKKKQQNIEDWLKTNSNINLTKYIEMMFIKLEQDPIRLKGNMFYYRIISVEVIDEIIQATSSHNISIHLLWNLRNLARAILYDDDIWAKTKSHILPVLPNWLRSIDSSEELIQDHVLGVLRSITVRYQGYPPVEMEKQTSDMIDSLIEILKQTSIQIPSSDSTASDGTIRHVMRICIILHILGQLCKNHPLISENLELFKNVLPSICDLLNTGDFAHSCCACLALEMMLVYQKWIDCKSNIFLSKYLDSLLDLCKKHEQLMPRHQSAIINILTKCIVSDEHHRQALFDADIFPLLKSFMDHTPTTQIRMNQRIYVTPSYNGPIRPEMDMCILLKYLADKADSGQIKQILDAKLLDNLIAQMVANDDISISMRVFCCKSITTIILRGPRNAASLAIEAGCLEREYFRFLVCEFKNDNNLGKSNINKVIGALLEAAFTLDCYGDACRCLSQAYEDEMMGIRMPVSS